MQTISLITGLYPDLPWEKSLKETPEKYESYVDLVVGEWTKVKIEVDTVKARLYVHGNEQPTLVVNDLKHGPAHTGSIGLWVGSGTEAHFRNLVITKNNKQQLLTVHLRKMT